MFPPVVRSSTGPVRVLGTTVVLARAAADWSQQQIPGPVAAPAGQGSRRPPPPSGATPTLLRGAQHLQEQPQLPRSGSGARVQDSVPLRRFADPREMYPKRRDLEQRGPSRLAQLAHLHDLRCLTSLMALRNLLNPAVLTGLTGPARPARPAHRAVCPWAGLGIFLKITGRFRTPRAANL